jgi:hypothetical protein
METQRRPDRTQGVLVAVIIVGFLLALAYVLVQTGMSLPVARPDIHESSAGQSQTFNLRTSTPAQSA